MVQYEPRPYKVTGTDDYATAQMQKGIAVISKYT